MAMKKTEKPASGGDLVMTRVFDAPRELVFRAWTDPQLAMRWWGPIPFTSPVCRMDPRVGGKYLLCMRSPDGKDFWSTGVYKEVKPPERLVMTDSFSDEKGNIVPASHYGMKGEFPLERIVSVTFEDMGGKTKMTIRAQRWAGGEMERMERMGWDSSFDKLAGALAAEKAYASLKTEFRVEPGKQEVVLMRAIDAPASRVFKAYTDPAIIPKWWGPSALTTEVEMLEAREGGRWRIIQKDKKGGTYAFHGVYHEVSPGRIIDTFEFEGMPGHVALETVTFEERAGKTLIVARTVFQSVADRDGMAASGMESGVREGMDRLEKALKKG